jgi:hypothetical protein
MKIIIGIILILLIIAGYNRYKANQQQIQGSSALNPFDPNVMHWANTGQVAHINTVPGVTQTFALDTNPDNQYQANITPLNAYIQTHI